MFSRASFEIRSCGNPRWGVCLFGIVLNASMNLWRWGMPHPVHYGSSVRWGWLKGSFILPAQPQNWVTMPEGEKPWWINLNLVQLNTVLVYLSTWGQDIAHLNFLAWQKWIIWRRWRRWKRRAPLLCTHVSERPILSHAVCVGSVAGKADRVPEIQSWWALRGVQKTATKATSLGLWKWRVVGLQAATLTFFSGKQILVYLIRQAWESKRTFFKDCKKLAFLLNLDFNKGKRLFAEVSFYVCNPDSCFSGHSSGDTQ